ncbi:glycosyltransferase [Barnesiella viscericola]|uniref:glycosyltransferase n=1 Tax=Barnesiella viscericola TaxID=397865 RepID=UPI002352F823|nr:glycosyltransferase [Barnesiella viscericola]
MNVLFAYPTEFNPQKGGIERVTDILVKALLLKGYTVFYLNWKRKEDEYNYPVPIIDLPSSDLKDPKNIEFYNELVIQNDIKVVINQHGLYEGTYFFSQIKKPGVKIISVFHSDPFGYYNNLFFDLITLRSSSNIEKLKLIARCILYRNIKRSIRKSLEDHYKFIQSHPQYICLLSESFKDPLEQWCKLPGNYFVTIPNPNTYENIESIPQKEHIVLFVGRLDNRQKKVNWLIDIWLKVIKGCSQWKLIIVGDGPDRDRLMDRSRGVINIEFVGRQDPRPYYEKASIFCLTSLFEGWGMVLTEAMQFGCVPIAFDSFSAVHDIIKPGKTGVLVKAFNKREYAKKLKYLMDNELYRIDFSRNAFEYVKRYDISNILPKWIELIEK